MKKTILILFITFFIVPSITHAKWYDSNYKYCRELTMTPGGLSGGVATTTKSGFPLVATSTISSLRTLANGGNIEITGTNNHGVVIPIDVILTTGSDCNSDVGSSLDFYFEKYVSSTGEFVLWVQPVDISSTTAKSVLMYYGNPFASDQSDEEGVFDSQGEVGVWNLSEDPSSAGSGGILDSTSNNNDGTDNGSMNTADQVAGQVNGAFDFDDNDDHIHIGSDLGISSYPFTFCAWFNPVTPENTTVIVSLNDFSATNRYYEIELRGGKFAAASRNTSYTGASGATTISANTWYHGCGRFINNSSRDVYLNGVFDGSNSGSESFSSLTDNTYIGRLRSSDLADMESAKFDDVRIYNRVLHSMDILTTYNNTVDSTTFWTIGSEETKVVAIETVSPIIKFTNNFIRLIGGRIIFK